MKEEALLPCGGTDADGRPATVRSLLHRRTDRLVVLNLFVEYSKQGLVDSFTTSLLAAVLLQILLKVTIAIEHRSRLTSRRSPAA
jgi:hypothetical protein